MKLHCAECKTRRSFRLGNTGELICETCGAWRDAPPRVAIYKKNDDYRKQKAGKGTLGSLVGNFDVPLTRRELLVSLRDGKAVQIERSFLSEALFLIQQCCAKAVVDVRTYSEKAFLTPESFRLNETGEQCITNTPAQARPVESGDVGSDVSKPTRRKLKLISIWMCALIIRAPIMLTLMALASVGAAAKRAYDWADINIPGVKK